VADLFLELMKERRAPQIREDEGKAERINLELSIFRGEKPRLMARARTTAGTIRKSSTFWDTADASHPKEAIYSMLRMAVTNLSLLIATQD
jgi:hypothetical protein